MRASGPFGRLLLVFLLFCVACTPARKKVRGDIVRRVRFEGNGGALSGNNDYQLRKAMEQSASAFGLKTFPLLYFIDPQLLNRDFLVRDAYRLEIWYAHHGWFDARFEGWSTRRLKPSTLKKAGIVDIIGKVEPGRPSTVRSIQVEGAEGAVGALARTVLRTGYLKEGAQYDLATAQQDRAQLEQLLKERGYAYATVDLVADAFPEEFVVDVTLTVDPGILASIGPVTITGNEHVRTKFIQQNLQIEEGDPYRLDELVAAQNRLFGMGTFTLVQVEPDLSDPTRKAVPITVDVDESKFNTVRAGVGFEIQGLQNFEPTLSIRYKQTNLFDQLIGLDLQGRVGALANVGDRPLVPTWGVRGALIYPRIAGQKVAQQLEVDIEQGVQYGLYRFFNPQASIRTIWKPSDVLVMSLGPHVEQWRYLDIDTEDEDQQQLIEALFGKGFQNPYQLTSVDYQITLDWRDDPLSTKRGSFFSGTLRAAFPLREGDYSFLAFTGDWRLFRPIRVGSDVPLTLATRVHGKALVPFGDSTLPYPELFFPGGASSMRGYPSRGMGPYEAFAIDVPNSDNVRRFFAPRGGTVGAILQEELRVYGAFDLTWALFFDVGVLTNPFRSFGEAREDLWIQQLSDGLRYAGGVGVRYGSPLGPLRVDLALRPRVPADDFRSQARTVKGAAAVCDPDDERRRIDVIHTFDKCAGGPALMLFLAFGESI